MARNRQGEQAWAAARVRMDVLARPDILDQVIIWRMSDPRYVERHRKRSEQPENWKPNMQRQWTIEARADFADAEKNEAITEAVRRAAVHINATIALISDGIKPQVVAFSDDFFSGHEDIALLEDTLGKAIAEHDAGEESQVSEEMMQAARDMAHDKNADKT